MTWGDTDTPEGKLRALVNASAAYTESERIELHRWINAAADAMSDQLAAFQTRDHEGDIRFWPTLAAAMDYADVNRRVWKVSFDAGRDRVRLVRSDALVGAAWIYEPLLEAAMRAIAEECT